MPQQTTHPHKHPRPSSAIMLLRNNPAGEGIEVFMVRRVIQSDFMPDVYVFPGGSVSSDDQAAELAQDICTPLAPTTADPEARTQLGSGVRAAAIRELFEEAGILLAYRSRSDRLSEANAQSSALPVETRTTGEILAITENDIPRFDAFRRAFQQRKGSLIEMAHAENLKLATDRLGYFAHWITPEGMPKRFETHFFITTAPAEQQAAHDRLETSEGIWISPAGALARSEQGTFPLVFATIRQLQELTAFNSVNEALQSTITHHVATHMPVLVRENGTTRVYLPGDANNSWEVPEHMTRPQGAACPGDRYPGDAVPWPEREGPYPGGR